MAPISINRIKLFIEGDVQVKIDKNPIINKIKVLLYSNMVFLDSVFVRVLTVIIANPAKMFANRAVIIPTDIVTWIGCTINNTPKFGENFLENYNQK